MDAWTWFGREALLSRPTLTPTGRRGRAVRVGSAVGVTVLAVVLFVLPRDRFAGVEALLGWGVPSEPAMHVLICVAVAFAWVIAFSGVRPLRLLLWGVLFALGAEALQLLPFVDRGVTWEDAGANVLGVGLGWLLAVAVRRLRSSS